jgi:hypothetical protein
MLMNHNSFQSLDSFWNPNGEFNRELKALWILGCFVANPIVGGLSFRKNIVGWILGKAENCREKKKKTYGFHNYWM